MHGDRSVYWGNLRWKSHHSMSKIWKFQISYRKTFKVMFYRVCGFRVRVCESYRATRSFGYGNESVAELPEVLGVVAQAYITHRSSGRVQKVLYPYPGYCGTGCTELTEVSDTGMNVLQNEKKFRVLWHGRT